MHVADAQAFSTNTAQQGNSSVAAGDGDDMEMAIAAKDEAVLLGRGAAAGGEKK